MKQLFAGFVALLFLSACSPAEPVNTETQAPIVIGAIGALSGDGAAYGIMTQNIAKIRVDEINAAGGINGRELQLLWEDGKCNAGDASKAAQKLLGVDKVSIIFGGVCSGETLGAAPITEKKKAILLTGVSSSAEVTNAGDYVFRTYPSDDGLGKLLAQYAENNFKKIGILTEQTDYAVTLTDVFTGNFSGEIINETFLTTESDFRTRIAKLKNEGVDALFINANTPSKTINILQQLGNLQWDTPLLGNEWILNEEVIYETLKLLTKYKAVGVSLSTGTDTPEYQEFIDKYQEEFGSTPEFTNYVTTIIDAIDVLVEVLKDVEDITDTDVIRDTLYDMSYEGMSGQVEFDVNGDVKGSHTLVQCVDSNGFVPLID